MPLSGSQAAYKEARSGMLRFGAGRFNWYRNLNAVVLINSTDRSTKIQEGSIRIRQVINDQPDTATFDIVQSPGFTPTAGETVSISIGSYGNREFGGQIARVRTNYLQGLTDYPLYSCECIDWGRLLDRVIVNGIYANQSATDIATSIIKSFTSGFTTFAVQSGLVTVDYFELTNETVSSALKRLANLIGGAYYIDAYRDLHFFGSGGDTASTAGTNPLQLTMSRDTLFSFSGVTDVTQLRTRVYVEGASSRLPLSFTPTGWPQSAGTYIIPVESSDPFETHAGTARIAGERITHTGISIKTPDGSANYASQVAANAAIGATSIQVDATQLSNWCRIGGQVIFFNGIDTGPTRLVGIPSSGIGSITAAITAGAQVEYLPALLGIPTNGTGAATLFHAKDIEVVPYMMVEDATAQSTMGGIEGGNGIHEVAIVDGRLNEAGQTARGNQDLTAYKNTITEIEWATEDFNARVGRQQSVNIGSINTTVLITEAEISQLMPNGQWIRRCRGSSLKQAGLEDVALRSQI